ncbi:MAG: zinc ribbon domain-containing protein [Chloroflexi bacterium]|nr:zinc ribbon domain-containing protein [Chloroflexota bacterium]
MPLYAYQCRNCGHEFETRQSFNDAPLTDCPNCHQSSVFRVIQAAGVVFKGSGWYVTDSKGKKDSVLGTSKSSTATDTSTATTTPVTPAETKPKPAEAAAD